MEFRRGGAGASDASQLSAVDVWLDTVAEARELNPLDDPCPRCGVIGNYVRRVVDQEIDVDKTLLFALIGEVDLDDL